MQQSISAAAVVQAIRQQKRIDIAEGCLQLDALAASTPPEPGTYKIPLRFSVPGSAEKPTLTLRVERLDSV